MPTSQTYLARDSLLEWLNSGQFRQDYKDLPEPQNDYMGGPSYYEKLNPVLLRIAAIKQLFPDGKGIKSRTYKKLRQCHLNEKARLEASTDNNFTIDTGAQAAPPVDEQRGTGVAPAADSPLPSGTLAPNDAMQDVEPTVGADLACNNEEMYDIEEGIRELSAATRNLARVRGLVELATASEQDTSERLLQTAATYRVSLSEYKLAVGRD